MTPGLRIKQQNCRKSKRVALSLINTADPALWDVILIQEPYIHPESTLTTASHAWNVLYPSPQSGGPASPSSVILINANLGPHCFQQITIMSNSITAVKLTPNASSAPITIFNVYNPPNTNRALDILDEQLTAESAPPSCTIIEGNFNKHHPLWAGMAHPQRCTGDRAEKLTHIISQFDLTLLSPCGTPTYQSDAHGTWSTLDLVFCTADIEDQLLNCFVAHAERLPGADHLLVHFTVNVCPQRSAPTKRNNFKKVDWPAFTNTLSCQLQDDGITADATIASATELDEYVRVITHAIQTAIKKHVPKS